MGPPNDASRNRGGDTSGQPGAVDDDAATGEPPSPHPSPRARDPSPARGRLGALGRSVLVGVGLVVAILGSLAAVLILGGDGEPAAVPRQGGSQPTPASVPDDEVPDTLPSATLAGFGQGQPVAIADYTGQPLLVNFWATWCPPCKDEIPALQAVYDDLGDQVQFLGVNVRDAPANAEAFADQQNISYPLAVDAQGEYYRAVGSRGMPTTLLVDAQGRVVKRHTGPLTRQQLRDLLAEQLGVTG